MPCLLESVIYCTQIKGAKISTRIKRINIIMLIKHIFIYYLFSCLLHLEIVKYMLNMLVLCIMYIV